MTKTNEKTIKIFWEFFDQNWLIQFKYESEII